ncbi:lipopolysaccharide biosynthesis protein, partial [Candidatus Omnitrophota bacterium]
MSITDKIIRNIFSSWAFYFIQLSIGFFLMPFMVSRLGAEIYGLWMLILSSAGYMYIFDFGIRGSAVKYISEYEAKEDFDTLNKVINTSWLLHIIAGLAVILIVFILSNFLQYFFKIDSHLINDFRLCFRIIGLNIGITFFLIIFMGILEGYKRQDIISGIEIAAFILQSFLIVLCIIRGSGIVSLAIILISVNVAKQAVRTILAFKICPRLRLGINFLSRATLRHIFSYSFFLFILQSLQNFLGALPNIILGALLGPIAITFYSIASRLIGYASTVLSTTSGVLVPFISSFQALDDKERLSKSFIVGSRYSYALVLFFGLTMLIMGKPFIKLWMGAKFAFTSYKVLLV